jgi:hypothetical protein
VADDQGNVIDITVTGPEKAVRAYLDSTTIRVEVGPPDAFKLRDLPKSYEGGKEDAAFVHQGNVVEIDIQVVQAKPSRHAVYLSADPYVPAGCSHVYRVGATNVSANCYPKGNDPDIVLLEWLPGGGPEGVNWARRGSSAADQNSIDGIPDTAWQSSGGWQLWIFDAYRRDCTYDLEGIFIQDPNPLVVAGRPPA